MPIIAARAHKESLPAVTEHVLRESRLTFDDVTAIAVSAGPGLSPCLYEGLDFVRSIAIPRRLPLIAVNHLEAHLLISQWANPDITFPFLGLLVSGGHTQLVLVHGVGRYEILGSTVDDAVGEAFDKVARLLGIERLADEAFGAALERVAAVGDPHRFDFPVPMLQNAGCDFSFAGLKSAVRQVVRGLESQQSPQLTPAKRDSVGSFSPTICLGQQTQADVAASFQRVAFQHLTRQLSRATQWLKRSRRLRQSFHIVLAGGVACNKELQRVVAHVSRLHGCQSFAPAPHLCSDNGIMVAWTGLLKYQFGHVESGAFGINTSWALGPRVVVPTSKRSQTALKAAASATELAQSRQKADWRSASVSS